VVAEDDRPIAIATRRERTRAATVREIKTTARRLLVEQGAESVTLRAIAREMGMTAPALYRYFDSHEALLSAVVADVYDELADSLEAARDTVATQHPGARLLEMGREFRHWSVEHPREFGLVFATPVPVVIDAPSPLDKAGSRFGAVFLDAFFAVFTERPFPVRSDAELPPDFRDQLEHYRQAMCTQLGEVVLQIPLGGYEAFLECWVRLYGFVALEVFDHLTFALSDPEPAFEAHLRAIATRLGITVPDALPADD
jgi:AcrR family transcriptional regulator